MVQFNPVSYAVTEGEQAAVTAVLNFVADRNVTVDFTTSDGSALGKCTIKVASTQESSKSGVLNYNSHGVH